MDESTTAYWQDHYGALAQNGPEWLDLSNERVQHQGFAVCLEAAACLRGKVCVDIGCGNGQLARLALALGAGRVIGLDFAPAVVERNRASCPEIDWRLGNILNQQVTMQLPQCDRVFLVEVLQYVDTMEVVRRLWPHLAPGGRLIGLVPNSDCPLVRQTVARFEGRYKPIETIALAALAESLDGLATWAVRGLAFALDQCILPYAVGRWTAASALDPVPNRLNFVLIKGV